MTAQEIIEKMTKQMDAVKDLTDEVDREFTELSEVYPDTDGLEEKFMALQKARRQFSMALRSTVVD